MPLTNGQTFAGYKIIRLLGSGGMGEVYLAQHPRLPRRDALKLLPHDWSADAEYRARFNREADVASTLWHPHIVGVHDRGEEDGQLWISMDFVDGLDAARLLIDKYPAGMPVEEVNRIVIGVASALDYAHKQGLLHRDVKPANIMITHLDDDQDEQRVLLADFGIARNVNEISGLTATNFVVGTSHYSAPEQLMSQDLDGRADQYALAASAYHLLAGAPLFPHANQATIIGHQLTTAPPKLAATHPDLMALDPVLAKALAKKPSERFSRCTDFAQAFVSAKVQPRRIPNEHRTGPPTSRGVRAGNSDTVSPNATSAAESRLAPMDKRVAMERVATHDDMREFTTNDAKDSAGKKSNDSGSVRTATSTPRQVAPTALQANRARIPRPKPVIAVAIGVLAALALGYILVVTGHTPRDPGSTHPVDVPPSADPEITFDGMRDFVAAYYADLPGHPDNAWAKLDTHCKDQTGYADFQKFWASIQSVTIVSVRPRDATSVVAQLNYVRRDGTSDSESRWLKVTPVNGAVLLDESGRIGSTNESPPPAPATRAPSTGSPGFSASSIDSVLPSPMEVSRVVRAGNLQIKSTQGMSDNSGLVTPFFCVGLIFGADRTVYSKSGFDAIIDQTLAASTSAPYTAAGPTEVEQTVVVFPTAQQAQAILASSQRQWQSCATGIVHYRVPNTNGEVGWGFNVGAVQLNDDILTASMAGINRESGDSACQQALGIRANVLVGARTCLMPDIPTSATVADPALAGNYAHLLVAEILSRIHD